MRYGRLLIVIVLVILGGLFLWGVSSRAADGALVPAASGSPSPSPSPTVSPSPVVPPASAAVVGRALKQRRATVAAWRQWNRARGCFGMRAAPFHRHSARAPARSASRARWVDAGSSWKHDRGAYRARVAHLVCRMKHPGGTSSGARWIPLAKWIGWPRYTLGTLAAIIYRESSGRERAYNGVIGCTGLLQIWPGHVSDPWRLTDPEYNLRVGLRLWRSQGWGPWAL